MKAEKLSDALNFLDDDLIAACDNAISARKSSATAKIDAIPTVKSETTVEKTTYKRAPSKITMIRIWGSVAAAAAVLVIGGIVLLSLNTSKSSDVQAPVHNAASNKDNLDLSGTTTLGVESIADVEVAPATDDVESYSDDSRSNSTQEFDSEHISAGEDDNVPAGSYSAGPVVVFEGVTYIVDTQIQLEVGENDYIGDLIGHAEEGSGIDFYDADIYEYTGQISRFIIVYVPDDDAYYLATTSDITP